MTATALTYVARVIAVWVILGGCYVTAAHVKHTRLQRRRQRTFSQSSHVRVIKP